MYRSSWYKRSPVWVHDNWVSATCCSEEYGKSYLFTLSLLCVLHISQTSTMLIHVLWDFTVSGNCSIFVDSGFPQRTLTEFFHLKTDALSEMTWKLGVGGHLTVAVCQCVRLDRPLLVNKSCYCCNSVNATMLYSPTFYLLCSELLWSKEGQLFDDVNDHISLAWIGKHHRVHYAALRRRQH